MMGGEHVCITECVGPQYITRIWVYVQRNNNSVQRKILKGKELIFSWVIVERKKNWIYIKYVDDLSR